jgi:hypothetical protein
MRSLNRAHCAALAACLAATATVANATPTDTRTPEAVGVQVALERVCLPLLSGKPLQTVKAGAGLHEDKAGWYVPLPGAERLSLQPPGGANPTVCSFKLTYPIGQSAKLVDFLNVWAKDHGLNAVAAGRPSTGPSERRRTWSWQSAGRPGSTALVFDTEKTLDGGPVAGTLDRATVLVSRSRPA